MVCWWTFQPFEICHLKTENETTDRQGEHIMQHNTETHQESRPTVKYQSVDDSKHQAVQLTANGTRRCFLEEIYRLKIAARRGAKLPS